MPPGRTHPKLEVALSMLRKGNSPRDVAEAVEVSLSTVYEWRRRYLTSSTATIEAGWISISKEADVVKISIDTARI